MQKIDKPWGYEIWFAHTDKYVGKILFIREGESLSLQYHKKKDETLYIYDGRARITVGNECLMVIPGRSVHIPPTTKHRVEAVVDTTIIEVSTSEVADVVRLENNYGRIKKDNL